MMKLKFTNCMRLPQEKLLTSKRLVWLNVKRSLDEQEEDRQQYEKANDVLMLGKGFHLSRPFNPTIEAERLGVSKEMARRLGPDWQEQIFEAGVRKDLEDMLEEEAKKANKDAGFFAKNYQKIVDWSAGRAGRTHFVREFGNAANVAAVRTELGRTLATSVLSANPPFDQNTLNDLFRELNHTFRPDTLYNSEISAYNSSLTAYNATVPTNRVPDLPVFDLSNPAYTLHVSTYNLEAATYNAHLTAPTPKIPDLPVPNPANPTLFAADITDYNTDVNVYNAAVTALTTSPKPPPLPLHADLIPTSADVAAALIEANPAALKNIQKRYPTLQNNPTFTRLIQVREREAIRYTKLMSPVLLGRENLAAFQHELEQWEKATPPNNAYKMLRDEMLEKDKTGSLDNEDFVAILAELQQRVGMARMNWTPPASATNVDPAPAVVEAFLKEVKGRLPADPAGTDAATLPENLDLKELDELYKEIQELGEKTLKKYDEFKTETRGIDKEIVKLDAEIARIKKAFGDPPNFKILFKGDLKPAEKDYNELVEKIRLERQKEADIQADIVKTDSEITTIETAIADLAKPLPPGIYLDVVAEEKKLIKEKSEKEDKKKKQTHEKNAIAGNIASMEGQIKGVERKFGGSPPNFDDLYLKDNMAEEQKYDQLLAQRTIELDKKVHLQKEVVKLEKDYQKKTKVFVDHIEKVSKAPIKTGDPLDEIKTFANNATIGTSTEASIMGTAAASDMAVAIKKFSTDRVFKRGVEKQVKVDYKKIFDDLHKKNNEKKLRLSPRNLLVAMYDYQLDGPEYRDKDKRRAVAIQAANLAVMDVKNAQTQAAANREISEFIARRGETRLARWWRERSEKVQTLTAHELIEHVIDEAKHFGGESKFEMFRKLPTNASVADVQELMDEHGTIDTDLLAEFYLKLERAFKGLEVGGEKIKVADKDFGLEKAISSMRALHTILLKREVLNKMDPKKGGKAGAWVEMNTTVADEVNKKEAEIMKEVLDPDGNYSLSFNLKDLVKKFRKKIDEGYAAGRKQGLKGDALKEYISTNYSIPELAVKGAGAGLAVKELYDNVKGYRERKKAAKEAQKVIKAAEKEAKAKHEASHAEGGHEGGHEGEHGAAAEKPGLLKRGLYATGRGLKKVGKGLGYVAAAPILVPYYGLRSVLRVPGHVGRALKRLGHGTGKILGRAYHHATDYQSREDAARKRNEARAAGRQARAAARAAAHPKKDDGHGAAGGAHH